MSDAFVSVPTNARADSSGKCSATSMDIAKSYLFSTDSPELRVKALWRGEEEVPHSIKLL
jgi:hypothetical protein